MKRLAFFLLLCVAPAASAQSIQDDLVTARAAHCQPASCTPEALAAILNDVAFKHRAEGVGLLSKPGGNHCPQPITGTSVSCDFLILRDGRGADVIQASDAEAIVHFQAFDYTAEQSAFALRFVAPVDPGLPAPVPVPVPPPVTDYSAALKALADKLDALSARLDDIHGEDQSAAQTVADQVFDLRNLVTALKDRPVVFPSYSGRILGQSFTLRPNQ